MEEWQMEQLLFNSIPQSHSRWRVFLASWGLQAGVVAGFLAVSAMFPQTVAQVRHFASTTLVAYESPQPKPYQPLPRVAAKALRLPELHAPSAIVLPRTERIVRPAEVAAPEIKIAAKLPEIPIAPQPKVIPQDTFSAGKADRPTTTKAAALVQTGGFGDPNGASPRESHSPANIAAS